MIIINLSPTTNLGEEEAIYSWAAINFLKGDLLSESKGVGPATGGKEGTFGTVDLGGASSQIAFYMKNQGTGCSIVYLNFYYANFYFVSYFYFITLFLVSYFH